MSIKEEIKVLKDKLYELEHTLDNNLNDVAKSSQKIIDDAGLPKNTAELWELYPPKAIADQQDSYPYTVTTEDATVIWITFWFPCFCVFCLICFGALLDF